MEDVSGQKVLLIGGTTTDSETLELYDMACHIAKTGAESLTIIIPYYGYSTMERAVKPGELVKGKTRARLLSSIPNVCPIKIMFMDLHCEGIPHYLEGNIQPTHLYGKKLIIKMCKNLIGDNEFVLASTDAGRAKWVESLANEMGVECAIITKRRISGTDTEIAGINADVKDKDVVIYDDMIRTGGSLMKAGKAYLNAGAKNVYAVATHGVFPNDSLFQLKASGIFKSIATTDTHPRSNELTGMPSLEGFYKVYTIAELLSDYIIEHYRTN